MCLHCGSAALGEGTRFCCAGCEAVYDLIHAEGLGRYYALRGARGTPVATKTESGRDETWLELLEARHAASSGPVCVSLDVQGIHCAACVWLLQSLFAREPGALRIDVNPALGRVSLHVATSFPLRAYVDEVQRFGYAFGPATERPRSASDGVLVRLGICAALAVNTMIFALPLYLGLREGPIHTLFRGVTFGLSVASVAVGGSYFVTAAVRALRRGILHLDLPIALGIVLAFAGSTVSLVRHRDNGTYFDTLTIFIALMLAGRWLQERVLDRNRRYLLASSGVDGLIARRVRDERVQLVPCRDIVAADVLLVAPGDLVPVASTLLDERASCSLDWISGESAPREFSRGDAIVAGAFNAGSAAFRVTTTEPFEASPLVGLLRPNGTVDATPARATAWWQKLSVLYVAAVLVLAAIGFAGWAAAGHVSRAIEVATAVLIVTCPCAFGIATPLAYELVHAALRRAGLFVRSSRFLDRAANVTRVAFDKTGTLTHGASELCNPEALDALSPFERTVLFNCAARSTHPKSAAVRRALEGFDVRFDTAMESVEAPGSGIEVAIDGSVWRLGRPGWAGEAADASDGDLCFARDGKTRGVLRTGEPLRPDAAAEVSGLERDGYDVWIVSGDAPERVSAMAERLHIAPDHALGGLTPEGKASWVATHDRNDTLMVGDGINDALAVERAWCSGTPSIERPYLPARTDFFLVTSGLAPIALALRASRALVRVHRRNLCVALGYNAGAVALALSGHMSPLLSAVLMPASSLSVLIATAASLSARSSLWRFSSCRSS